MDKRLANDSLTIKTAQILPPDTNAYGTLFGGKLMAYIDDVALIAAVRHSRHTCVTASTDSVDFLSPVKLGDFVILEAFVTSTHKTSMEVFVKALTESFETGEKKVCATAFLTFVALNEDDIPIPVPGVIPESPQQLELFDSASLRRKRRSEKRRQSIKMAKEFSGEIIKRKER